MGQRPKKNCPDYASLHGEHDLPFDASARVSSPIMALAVLRAETQGLEWFQMAALEGFIASGVRGV
jgi:hypothetical protein